MTALSSGGLLVARLPTRFPPGTWPRGGVTSAPTRDATRATLARASRASWSIAGPSFARAAAFDAYWAALDREDAAALTDVVRTSDRPVVLLVHRFHGQSA